MYHCVKWKITEQPGNVLLSLLDKIKNYRYKSGIYNRQRNLGSNSLMHTATTIDLTVTVSDLQYVFSCSDTSHWANTIWQIIILMLPCQVSLFAHSHGSGGDRGDLELLTDAGGREGTCSDKSKWPRPHVCFKTRSHVRAAECFMCVWLWIRSITWHDLALAMGIHLF